MLKLIKSKQIEVIGMQGHHVAHNKRSLPEMLIQIVHGRAIHTPVEKTGYASGREERKYNQNPEDLNKAKVKLEKFLAEFVSRINAEQIKTEVYLEDNILKANITGENIGFFIGYRGEVLESLQTVLSTIVNSHKADKIKVVVDVEGYRQKRIKTLEDLAEKISKTVVRTGKTITLEPMSAYERKIIHSKIQGNPKIVTHSVGEEPYRKIVVSLK